MFGLSTREAARRVAEVCGESRGIRLLHVSDFHNRWRGFKFAAHLAESLHVEMVINTGDLSGVGGAFEQALLTLCPHPKPRVVLAPGNHDSEATYRALAKKGWSILDAPGSVSISGLTVWGYRDPNRSVIFGPSYDSQLCRAAAMTNPPPHSPVVIAVHNELMVSDAEPAIAVLSGHFHRPRVRLVGGTLYLRCGSTGGGGPFGGRLHAAILDLVGESVDAVWLVEVGRREVTVRAVSLDSSAE